MAHRFIASRIITPLFGKIPTHPSNEPPHITVDPDFCGRNGKPAGGGLRSVEADFGIVRRVDVKHRAADALSRLCTAVVDGTGF